MRKRYAAVICAIIAFSVKVQAAPVELNMFDTPQNTTQTLQIVFLLTVLTLAPSILIMMTGFTRIIIVLSFIRNAMGTQQMPPNQVIIGLALFLTFFVMTPVISEVNTTAYKPYIEEQITQEVAFANAQKPIRKFMGEQINERDLDLFMSLGNIEPVDTFDEIPMHVVIPAFITSEIKTAFQIGFFIFIPFLVIDMIVASTLMSMGMMMLPPVMISLPFKILLFVLVDGWGMTIKTLIASFG